MICELYDMTVRRVYGKPEAWTAYRFSCDGPPGFIKITGSVPVGTYSRGKKKGRPKWNLSISEECWISLQQIDETRRDWESANEKCYECRGTREAVYSWSATTGQRKAPCRRCKATGLPPTQEGERNE